MFILFNRIVASFLEFDSNVNEHLLEPFFNFIHGEDENCLLAIGT